MNGWIDIPLAANTPGVTLSVKAQDNMVLQEHQSSSRWCWRPLGLMGPHHVTSLFGGAFLRFARRFFFWRPNKKPTTQVVKSDNCSAGTTPRPQNLGISRSMLPHMACFSMVGWVLPTPNSPKENQAFLCQS